MTKAVFVLAAGGGIAVLAVMIWGWVRWWKHAQPKTLFSTLSFVGFGLATVSGLLAISSVLYAQLAGGFSSYDVALVRIYRWGALLSLAGAVFAIVGLWRPNALRWHAPVCAVGTLVFWLVTAAGE